MQWMLYFALISATLPTILLHTTIKAPRQRVFDLSRSISLHTTSMQHTAEKAVGGRTSGLIEFGESVTWQARHLFKTRYLTTRITTMRPYDLFVDEMTEGDFRSMKHVHLFEDLADGTMMTDEFTFESPYGPFGELLNLLFLTGYMRRLLTRRNEVIKHFAETDNWQQILL